MRITHGKGNSSGRKRIAEAIECIVGEGEPHPLVGVDLDNLKISDPHDVLVADLKDLAEGSLHLRQTGSRYLLFDGTRAVADIELDNNEEFQGLHRNSFVRETVAAVAAAQASDEHQGDYELKYLKIPALYLVCASFHSKNLSLFVPLAPAPVEVEVGRFYREAELLRDISPLAKRLCVNHN